MTDLEIDKALAIAIGWKSVQTIGNKVLVCTGNPHDRVHYAKSNNWIFNHRIFDHRDWATIGPIAAKYNCFPYRAGDKWWNVAGYGCPVVDKPQTAIALAVIQGAET